MQPAPISRPPFSFAKRSGLLVGDLLDASQDHPTVEVFARPDVGIEGLTELRRFLSHPFSLTKVDPSEFDRLLQRTYESGAAEAMNFDEEFEEQEADLSSVARELSEPQDLLESQDDAPIIRLINALLTEAIKEGASDIHIEPYESRLMVRFRVDGTLREILQPPKALAPLVVSRVKVMARLNIAEKRLPQDGRISLKVAGRAVDVRVSTIPSGHGERIVLRLLDKQAGKLDLDQLGMPADVQQGMDRIIHKPHGIILVTGPTGSGKSTTLYASLMRLNDRSKNILTVEDPIEYYIEGIGQTQVNSKIEMTFARGLRAILRQDPDVVMVGEIRDLETAEIAVQASLTGHLVLSTLHTNTAAGAIARLRDMGVEPFLLSSSIIGLAAQRLVRKLCEACKDPYQPDATERVLLGLSETEEAPDIYHATGCDACRHTGFHGRSGIYELIEIDEQLRTMIHEGESEQRLEQYARTRSRSIRQHSQQLVLSGVTTISEILRVTRED